MDTIPPKPDRPVIDTLLGCVLSVSFEHLIRGYHKERGKVKKLHGEDLEKSMRELEKLKAEIRKKLKFEKSYRRAERSANEYRSELMKKPQAELVQLICDHEFGYHCTEHFLKHGIKFRKSSKANKINGKKGGKQADQAKIDRAKKILIDYPPLKKDCSSYAGLAAHLTNHGKGEEFKKDWIGVHFKHAIKK